MPLRQEERSDKSSRLVNGENQEKDAPSTRCGMDKLDLDDREVSSSDTIDPQGSSETPLWLCRACMSLGRRSKSFHRSLLSSQAHVYDVLPSEEVAERVRSAMPAPRGVPERRLLHDAAEERTSKRCKTTSESSSNQINSSRMTTKGLTNPHILAQVSTGSKVV